MKSMKLENLNIQIVYSVNRLNLFPAYLTAKIHKATRGIVTSDSQRTLEYSAKITVTIRLTPTAIALANLCTNISINALALYFSSRLVGTYSVSLADWLIEYENPLSSVFSKFPTQSMGNAINAKEPAKAANGNTKRAVLSPNRVIMKLVRKNCTNIDTKLVIAKTVENCLPMAGPSR